MTYEEALKIAVKEFGLPVVICALETSENFLFVLGTKVPSANNFVEIGQVMQAVSKKTGEPFIYIIPEHMDDFSKASSIS